MTILEYNPGNPYALVSLGVALEREGNYEQAIMVYQRLLTPPAGTNGAANPVPAHLIEIDKENLNHAKNLRQKLLISPKTFYHLDFLFLFLFVYYIL